MTNKRTDKQPTPQWQLEFKFTPPEKLGGVRKFERCYRDTIMFMAAAGLDTVLVDGTLGHATTYLCAAIDAGFITSPESQRDGDTFVMGDIDVLDADTSDYAQVIWCGTAVANKMREITHVPFGLPKK